jgi:hypothetical protein
LAEARPNMIEPSWLSFPDTPNHRLLAVTNLRFAR